MDMDTDTSMPPPPPPLKPMPPKSTALPPGMKPPPPPGLGRQVQIHDAEMDMEDSHDAAIYGAGSGGDMDNDDSDIKVVSHFQPRVASGPKATGPMTMVDPISGKVIPVDQMGGT